ncbi:Carbohydrate sulfotransferase [Ooceraea biroi]|uniref:Carbohydrate sulfotransferase n=1 Tax=Ooceraea biroi TaxID=2015173 RepID=A0A026WFE3_OOCBI|nr:Carbohydrate sulfotransferase [Ooceraea biroi]
MKSYFLREISQSAKHQQPTLHTSIADKIIKKNVETEINSLQTSIAGRIIKENKSTIMLQQTSHICARYALRTRPIKRHFIYSAKHKSLYCWIHKVASTSFVKLFSDMNRQYFSRYLYREVDALSPNSLEDLHRLASNNTVFKLLVVRHPFQRLVSSYRDRIEDSSRYTAQAWLYAREIFYLSRPQLFHFNTSSGNVLQRIFFPNRRLKLVPSFREFLVWLLNQPPDTDDNHWGQYYTHCAVCNVSYSFVLKLDDYDIEEVNYVLSKLRLNGDEVYLPKLHRTHNGVTDFNVTCKYFGSLTTDMVLRLHERYKMDFEMYNYKIDDYLHCARQK